MFVPEIKITHWFLFSPKCQPLYCRARGSTCATVDRGNWEATEKLLRSLTPESATYLNSRTLASFKRPKEEKMGSHPICWRQPSKYKKLTNTRYWRHTLGLEIDNLMALNFTIGQDKVRKKLRRKKRCWGLLLNWNVEYYYLYIYRNIYVAVHQTAKTPWPAGLPDPKKGIQSLLCCEKTHTNKSPLHFNEINTWTTREQLWVWG